MDWLAEMSHQTGSIRSILRWCLRYLRQGWGYTCYLVWLAFSQDELGIFAAPLLGGATEIARIASLLAILVGGLIIVAFAPRFAPLRHKRDLMLLTGVMGSVGTTLRLIAQAGLLGSSAFIIGCAACGLTSALIVAAWLERFMDQGLHSVVWSYFACAIASIPVCCLLAVVPAPLAWSVLVALPLASIVSLLRAPAVAPDSKPAAQEESASGRAQFADAARILVVVALSSLATQAIRLQSEVPSPGLTPGSALVVSLLPSLVAAAAATVIATYAYLFHTSSVFYVAVPVITAAALLTLAQSGSWTVFMTSTLSSSLCDHLLAQLAICLFLDMRAGSHLRYAGALQAAQMVGAIPSSLPTLIAAGPQVTGVMALVCMIAVPLVVMSSTLAFSMKQSPVEESGADVTRKIEAVSQEYSLTPREREVLLIWGTGHTGACVEERLGITRNTVRTHLDHIYQKTGSHSKEELLQLIDRHA